MSRIGKNAVAIPEGVELSVTGQDVKAKGKLGEMSLRVVDEIAVEKQDNSVSVKPKTNSKFAKQMWATSRTLINNIVQGVSEGFSLKMVMNGVGYRAAVQGKQLVMQLGYSHEVKMDIPEGITVTVEKQTNLELKSLDKQKLGQFAANIRKWRPPEPYKGKGIKFENEYIFRKEGKKK